MTPERLMSSFPRPVTPAGPRPVLIAVCGLPASGKSYFVRALAARLPLAHLASDDLRMVLTDGRPTYAPAEHALVFATLKGLSEVLLAEGHTVVVDATGVRGRDRASSLAAACSSRARTVLVWCEVPEELATQRLTRRDAGADPLDRSEADAVVRARMAAHASPPGKHEADLVLRCGPDDLERCLRQVSEAVRSAS